MTRWRRLVALLLLSCLGACDLTEEAEKTVVLDKTGLFSANLSGHYALIGNLSGDAQLWQLSPTALMHKWRHRGASDGVIALDIAVNENYALTAERTSIAWWRIGDGALLGVWNLTDVYSASISADGTHALIGLADRAIYFSLRDAATRFEFPHDGPVVASDLSDSGRYALTGSEDHTARLWDLRNGELVRTWHHDNQLATVALSHSDRFAVTSAALSQVRLWKLSTGKLHKTIGSQRVTLASVAFSADDDTLLTGHLSGLIERWDTGTGERLTRWRAKKKAYWRPSAATLLALSFSDDGKRFYSLAANGYLQRWSVP